jgi:hypothetical protein
MKENEEGKIEYEKRKKENENEREYGKRRTMKFMIIKHFLTGESFPYEIRGSERIDY